MPVSALAWYSEPGKEFAYFQTRIPEPWVNIFLTDSSSTEKYWDLLLAAVCPPLAVPPAQPATAVQDVTSSHPHSDGAPTAPAAAADAVASPDHPNTEHPYTEHRDTRTLEPLNPEQDGNRTGTGFPGTHASQPGE